MIRSCIEGVSRTWNLFLFDERKSNRSVRMCRPSSQLKAVKKESSKTQKTTVNPHMLKGAPYAHILDIKYRDNLQAFSLLCCPRVTVKHAFNMLHI